MASFMYTTAVNQLLRKSISMTADTFKVALVSVAPTDAGGGSDAYSSLTNELASANGYTAAGATLAGTLSLDITSAPHVKWKTTADTTWASASFTAVGAVIYDDTTSPKYLICYCDFGGSKTGGGGNFTLNFSSATNGIIQIN